MIGAKEKWRSSDGLTIESNVARFAPGAEPSSGFVVDFTGDKLVMRDNDLAEGLRPLERR